MSYSNDAFQFFREECLVYIKEKEQEVIERWLEEIGFTEPVGYYRNGSEQVMEIYTTRPGVLIGKAGESVRAFEKLLSAYFGGAWTVEFVEIRGGFLNLGK